MHVRLSTKEDCARLAPFIKESDTREIEVLGNGDPLSALLTGLSGHVCLTVVDDAGRPIVMFGTSKTHLPGVGGVWMLGAAMHPHEAVRFARESRLWVDLMLMEWDMLCNVTLPENTTTIRWLKWCGFTFLDLPTEPDRAYFYKENPNV